MSSAKFAPMTSSLLARKGEAGPSLGAMPAQPAWRDWRGLAEKLSPSTTLCEDSEDAEPPPMPIRAVSIHAPEHLRKLIIRLSPEEHERLGIAAVKKGVTRNQLVRAALDSYTEALLREYGRACACIAGSCRSCES